MILPAKHNKIIKFEEHSKHFKWKRMSLDILAFRVYICKNYEGQDNFINKKLDEIYSYENLSAEKVIYFLVSFFTVYVFSLAS